MKTKLIALALCALTGAAVVLYPGSGNTFHSTFHSPGEGAPPPDRTPPVPGAAPRVEVVFVLDTTGSMGGLIQTAKEKIWSIASTMASAQPAPEIRMGLVAYRDRGDAYLTRVTDLSTDLDSVYATLMDYRAEGGGDGPESVNAALASALDQISWSQNSEVYRVVFLVGDAPPHMDYQDEERYPDIVTRARDRGIVINTIRCGESPSTEEAWRRIAALAGGDYFSVDQAGGAVAITTPYDEKLAALSAQLDDTRLFFGNGRARERGETKAAATSKLHHAASEASRARRAAFNASGSGQANLFGDLDLVAALESGKLRLEDVAEEALPESIQPMTPVEREDYVARQAEKRTKLEQRIRTLADERAAYLSERAESLDGVRESLDYRLYDSIRAQGADKGLGYHAPAPRL